MGFIGRRRRRGRARQIFGRLSRELRHGRVLAYSQAFSMGILQGSNVILTSPNQYKTICNVQLPILFSRKQSRNPLNLLNSIVNLQLVSTLLPSDSPIAQILNKSDDFVDCSDNLQCSVSFSVRRQIKCQ